MNFDDLNTDAINGAEIMGLLGLNSYQLDDPIIFNRVSEVVKYLSNVPDKSFFVNRLTVGKNVNKLDHVWSYIQVLQKKGEIENKLGGITNELKGFLEQKSVMEQDLSRIKEEQTVYEK